MIIESTKTRRIFVVTGAAVLLFGIVSFLIFTQRIKGRAQETATQSTEKPGDRESAPPQPASATLVLSRTPADQSLQRRIDELLNSSDLASPRWGICVMSLRDGRVLYVRDADRSFVPASNMKLFTTAVALDLLGATHDWKTSVYAKAPPDERGIIAGDLTLYGRGAPDLSSSLNSGQSLIKQLADELYRRGVRQIRGNIVGDETYFRGEPLGDGWMWNDVQWYYGAEVSALSVGGNEISLSVTPGVKLDEPARVKLEPETNFVEIKNDTLTVDRDKPVTIGITRGLSNNVFRVWGDFPLGGAGFRARLAVHRPALWAGALLRDELRKRGATIEGSVTATSAIGQRQNESFDVSRHVELASVTSMNLGAVSRKINKESLNLEAELVLRTLGKEKGATAPDPEPRKMAMRGDDEAGLAVIRAWLVRAGIPIRNIALHDGSGLSRLDLVTPEATVRLLVAMSKSPEAGIFRESLPIAGRDGTLHNRLRSATSRIFAKTGTLTDINSLSGYVITDEKEILAFSIFCNNDLSPAASMSIIDSLILLLADYRQRQSN